jgi:phosphoenolpyruvate-protein phosphotransferase (PTS system enzyme I)
MKSEVKGRGARRARNVLEGLGVAPGIAIGPAHIVEAGALRIPEYAIEEAALADELARFQGAVARAQKQLRKLQTKSSQLQGAAAEEIGYLLEAYQQMLTGSRLVRGVERRIATSRINAEAAVQAEISEIAQSFAAMDDSYLAARGEDIREVGNRLIRNLTKTPYEAFTHLPAGTVVVAEELSPADTALLDPARIAGFVTVLGGPEGHTAIMARSLGMPAVVGVAGLFGAVKPGDTIVLDGNHGRVVVNPGPAQLAEYQRRRSALDQELRELARLRRVIAVTRDGTRISLMANLELPRETEIALQAGAEGIGLLRTEFLFMNRASLPDEDEQYAALREIVLAMAGRPVTVRTLDVGGEKLADSLSAHIGESANPALGLRAIRLSLKERPLLEAQLAAILRAGAHGPVRILLPMISSTVEVRQVREVLDQVAKRLKRRGVELGPPPPLGIMIEVPGAALTADALAQLADFFAIGTNDLTQYTLAIDRGEEQVAHLFNPLHPAVLRLIQFTAEAALRARIPISVCGEIAGDPRYTALLLGLGVRELSMSAMALARVKQRIRGLDILAATRRAREIMDQSDSGRIATLLDDFNALA